MEFSLRAGDIALEQNGTTPPTADSAARPTHPFTVSHFNDFLPLVP
jgi:hypothetical protein